MTAAHIDPERLAALLDGRLSPAEAAVVRAQLAQADDDTLAAYADAVAVTAELTPSVGRWAVANPLGSARRKTWWIAAGAVAATILGIVAVRAGRNTEEYQPAIYASALDAGARPNGQSVWSVTRGTPRDVASRARAARIGALLTDVELEALRLDTSTAHLHALAAELDGMLGGDALASRLRTLVGQTGNAKAQLRAIGTDVMALLPEPGMADAGAYLEAARIAATFGDATFFDRQPAREALDEFDGDALGEETKKALASFLLVAETRPRDAVAIRTAVEALLRLLTR